MEDVLYIFAMVCVDFNNSSFKVGSDKILYKKSVNLNMPAFWSSKRKSSVDMCPFFSTVGCFIVCLPILHEWVCVLWVGGGWVGLCSVGGEWRSGFGVGRQKKTSFAIYGLESTDLFQDVWNSTFLVDTDKQRGCGFQIELLKKLFFLKFTLPVVCSWFLISLA